MHTLSHYMRAAICERGHVVDSANDPRRPPGEQFCQRCGARVIEECPTCSKGILGTPIYNDGMGPFAGHSIREAPAYCSGCGTGYPWTEARVRAIKDLAREELNDQELDRFDENLRDLLHDGPRTELAAHRVSKMLKNATEKGKQILWRLVVEVSAEMAKGYLRGEP